MRQQLRWFLLSLVLCTMPSLASAEQLRFRFVPTNACGATAQVPIGPEGTMGELRRVLGVRPLPYPFVVRANQIVTFRHPYNGRNISVPLRMPEGQPRLEHRADRIVYNFGDYTVEARFNPDGSVDVIYNSGLLRPLPF